jgi:hypothetical protein
MVTLNITNGPSFQVIWFKGMNAQNVMEAAFNGQGTPRTFTYMLQYYGPGLGYLVDMINGTFDTALSSDAPYFFWDFIVDNNNSNTGIDGTPISDGQTITFSYTLYNAATHSNTVLGEKYSVKSAK